MSNVSLFSKPLVYQLDQYLADLVHWQTFGIHLPRITHSTIQQIELDYQGIKRQKLALYATWLKQYPNATWENVCDALESANESQFQEKLRISLESSKEKIQEIEMLVDTEDKIAINVRDLYIDFVRLVVKIRTRLDEMTKENKHILMRIARHLEAYFGIRGLTKAHSSDELFDELHSYYSFLNCELLYVIVSEFVPGDLQIELDKHITDIELFKNSTTLGEFKTAIEQALIQTPDVTSSTCQVIIKVSGRWAEQTVRSLDKLLHHIFSKKKMILNHVSIEPGSLCITFLVHQSESELLNALALQQLEFMSLVGVFEMIINNQSVLVTKENEEFSFESAFIKASETGINEVVKFLLDLGVYVNHSITDGKTALMLACMGGHEEIIQVVISAGADVNLQDNEGYTALMFMTTRNIHQLLQSGADITTNNTETASSLRNLRIVEILLREGNPNTQNEHGQTALMLACQNGHLQVTELLLKEGANPNIHDEDGWTPILYTSQNGHFQVAESLLKEGADVNVRANNGATALILACQNGHFQVAELLLKEGADVNVRTHNDGETALMICCVSGHLEVAELLLKEGADVNVHANNGATALILACHNGHFQVAEVLLKEGAGINIRTNDGLTALMFACVDGHFQVAELLLKEGADVNVRTHNDGATALMICCVNGHLEVAELLLKEGADVNVHANNGATALILACHNGHFQVAELLLKEGADVNVRTHNDGETALMICCVNGHLEVAELLLKEGANVNVHANNGATALILACHNGHFQVAEVLLKEGAGINIRTNDGLTALMFACQNGHLQVAELLLKEGADVNVRTHNDGATALMICCLNGHLEVAELLLKEGAGINIRTHDDGVTALMFTCVDGHFQVAELLLKEGADVNVRTHDDGVTALILACESGHLQVAELLLKEGADVNVHANNGATALILACHNGHFQVAELLLKEGADVNVCRNDGWTAFMLACQNGHFQVAELLLKEGADINVRTHDDGVTALMVACQNGHLQVAELLLKEGADVNVLTHDNGVTALMFACQDGHLQVAELLLKEGADVNVCRNDGGTALILACANGHLQVAELLLKEGADVNVRTHDDGVTALILACESGHLQVAELLLKEGADVNVQDGKGSSALSICSQKGRSDFIKLLMTYKANPSVCVFLPEHAIPVDSFTLAALSGNVEVVSTFLSCTGLGSNSLSLGWYHASNNGHAAIIKLLSSRIGIVHNLAALIVSCVEGDLGYILNELKSNEMMLDVEFVHGVTPLMVASSCGQVILVDALIESGADVNKTDEFGCTALNYASVATQEGTKKSLLNHGGVLGNGLLIKSDVDESPLAKHKGVSLSESNNLSDAKIVSAQSFSTTKKKSNPKKRLFSSLKNIYKKSLKISRNVLILDRHIDNREYSKL